MRAILLNIFKAFELDDFILPNAKPGTTGFVLLPGRSLRGKSSRILLVSTDPVNKDVYATVAVSGKAEALPAAELLSRILSDLASNAPLTNLPESVEDDRAVAVDENAVVEE